MGPGSVVMSPGPLYLTTVVFISNVRVVCFETWTSKYLTNIMLQSPASERKGTTGDNPEGLTRTSKHRLRAGLSMSGALDGAIDARGRQEDERKIVREENASKVHQESER